MKRFDSMFNKFTKDIANEDIQRLIQDEIRESRTLDYKEDLPGNASHMKREFCADVSSFANASGGYLIYGIRERKDQQNRSTGEPEASVGVSGGTGDEIIQRLENMIRDGIEPRIRGIEIKAVDGFPRGPVIVIRIPKSWAAPHMVSAGNSRFFTRHSVGKYALDVGEIRAAFALSEAIPNQVRNFRAERVARIVAGETPLQMENGPKTILHAVPMSALDPRMRIDVIPLVDQRQHLRPIAESGWDHRFNFDAFVTYGSRNSNLASSYTQVFRSGIIESVEANLLEPIDNRKTIPSAMYEQHIIDAAKNYLKLLQDLEVSAPVFLMLSLIGVRNFKMAAGIRSLGLANTPIDRDNLILPESTIESYDEDVSQTLKLAFDTVWQSCGFSRSLNYDSNGNWKTRS